jgi:4-amino-4-deoxy-L-arabinose transferase-like glycosyltransferase
MKLLGLLMPILTLVALVAFIWLTVVAFKRSMLWGFLVLLLSPITAVIFAVKYWQESKKPFLIYAGSVAGCFVIVISMITFMGGFAMMAMANAAQQGELNNEQIYQFTGDTLNTIENSGMLDEQEQADMRDIKKAFLNVTDEEQPAETNALQAAVEAVPASSEQTRTTDTVRTLKVRSEPAPKPAPTVVAPGGIIPMRQAGNYVGKRLRVKLRDGHEYEGTLASWNSEDLQLDHHLPGGVVAIHLVRSEIRSLQLAKR